MKWFINILLTVCIIMLLVLCRLQYVILFYYSDDVTKNLEYEECTRYFYDYHYIMDSSEPNT